ncbi:MAG: alpha/beta hydrolase-fold protein [Chloroflexi bacterium]|nr:alpha/beta hydrolase-fold protein [Chloroflexota bacterium]
MKGIRSNLILIFFCCCFLSACDVSIGYGSQSSPTVLPAAATFEPTLSPIPSPTITPTAQPTALPTPLPCFNAGGVVERIMIPSVELEKGLYVTIYIPPCYDPKRKYPVLYLLHGQAMTDRFWVDLGVTQIADHAIQNGQAPFMIVMPFEERNFDPMLETKFGDSMIKELIPFVDKFYATCTQRTCRAIGGVSRGGGWAIRLGMRNFDLFGAIGGHSFALPEIDNWWPIHQLESHAVEEFPRIYIDRGDQDYLCAGIDDYEKLLTFTKIPHEYHTAPGTHGVAYWQLHVQEYMDFYMAGWQ